METPVLSWKKKRENAYKVVSTILLVPLSLVENLRNSNFLAIFLIYVLSNPEFPVLKEIQRFEWSEFQSKTISKRMFGKFPLSNHLTRPTLDPSSLKKTNVLILFGACSIFTSTFQLWPPDDR